MFEEPIPRERLNQILKLLRSELGGLLRIAHHSLHQSLEAPQPTRGTGSPKKWAPVTPAMAAGITDHVWATRELLSYRVPAKFLDQLSKFNPLFSLIKEAVRQGK